MTQFLLQVKISCTTLSYTHVRVKVNAPLDSIGMSDSFGGISSPAQKGRCIHFRSCACWYKFWRMTWLTSPPTEIRTIISIWYPFAAMDLWFLVFVQDMVRQHAGFLTSLLTAELTNMFPNEEWISGVTCPVLIGEFVISVLHEGSSPCFRMIVFTNEEWII